MHGNSGHCGDIAYIRRNGLVTDGIGRMKSTDEMRVFSDEIGTENQGIALGDIDDGGIVADADRKLAGSFRKTPANSADDGAFAGVAELHTVASTPFRRRRGPRTTLPGFFVSSRAALKTLCTSSTNTKFISLRMVSFTSSRSRLFKDGRITVSILTRRAARTFSLIPPTGSTSPRRVISPVIAILRWTALPVSSDKIAVAIVTPADGPSFGMAPSGT